MVWLAFFLLTWIVPGLFFLGILAKTIRKDVRERANLHSEPFVLMFLGLWFLAVNGPLMGQFIVAMEFRLGAGIASFLSPDELTFFRFSFGVAALAVIATLAKAFWTHVMLEEGVWGRIHEYRKPLWDAGLAYGWGEYAVRCIIAVLIVLMQKELSNMSKIPHISDLSNGIHLSQAAEAVFVEDFSKWLGGFSRLGVYLFLMIWVWLAIVSIKNMSKSKEAWMSFAGTALSAVPSLLVVWFMYMNATGEMFPIPFFDISVQDPSKVVLIASTVVYIFCSIVIFSNLLWVLWRGPVPEIRNLALGLVKKRGPASAGG